jgi:hypothetical protein
MNDLDSNYFLPLWQALVRYFRAYPPLVQDESPRLPPSRGRGHKTSREAWSGQTPHRI